MTVSVDLSELTDGLEDLSDEVAREAAGRAFTTSQDVLYEAGDKHEYEVYPVAQSGHPPEWDETAGGYVFGYTHLAAKFFEYGTEPHEIRAKRAEFLRFEWPDAPPAVREMFEETFPVVFFKKVQHPGTPALGFVAGGMREAASWLEGRGGSR